MRAYEIVYILDAALDQAAVNAKLETFHATLGGEITSVDHWGVRQLAYPIRKAATGYYVIVQVSADSTALPEFERLLKLDEETMRYLIVLNEGQSTSGASILAARPAPPESGEDEDEEEDEEDEDAEDEEVGDEDEDEKADDEAGGDDSDEGGDDAAEGDAGEQDAGADDAESVAPSSGPPIFTGSRGRRRRHEGPPIVHLNYKDVATLSRFLNEQGRILPKRTTKVPARFQRQLGTAVKRARFLALLPYIKDHGS